jgi:DNA-directed RNA polymerase subunit omega
MARVTVEDCIKIVPNRFELVVLAGQRSREIASGSKLTIDRDNDKNPVLSLREIAAETVSTKDLGQSVIQNYRKHVELDEAEQEMADMLMAEQDLSERELEIGSGDNEEIVSIEEAAEFEEAMEAKALAAEEDE